MPPCASCFSDRKAYVPKFVEKSLKSAVSKSRCLVSFQRRRRGCRRCRSASEANVRSRAPSPVYRATMRNGRHVVVKRLEKPSRPTWCSSSAQLSSMTQARQLRPPARLRVRHHGHPLRRPARYRLISLKAGT
jgi:hypothetical protein